MDSFGVGAHAIVFGASGGIGAAVTQQLCESGAFDGVHAFARDPGKVTISHEKLLVAPFDLNDERSIEDAASQIAAPVHLVFVATGMLHTGEDEGACFPEKTWRDLAPDPALHSFALNALGPMLIAKHFLPKLDKTRKSAFAAISARVGSISDNQIGGWYAYRASKAALHQFIRCSAIELQRKNKQALCVALHPGTVDTDLSAPFQKNVKAEKLFGPAYSARAMLSTLDALTPEATGQIFAYDGSVIDP